MTVSSILDFDFRQLSLADRLTLIQRIEESIDSEPDSGPVSPQQLAEMERRTKEADEHPERLLTIDQLKDQLRRSR